MPRNSRNGDASDAPFRHLRRSLHQSPCISAGLALKDSSIDPRRVALIELLIVDEAERLNFTALEWLNDLYDRAAMGLILTGIEKSIARYAQLYSRAGFAHEYRPLQGCVCIEWRGSPAPSDPRDMQSLYTLTAHGSGNAVVAAGSRARHRRSRRGSR
ncbi:AAA family ATPase [Sulfitobacter sp. AS92]|uniref:AAA family ATPase n=1 Tax=Sulfitobacter sp. AS92 TaxID=3135783 RepID=UPI00317AB90C